MTIITSDIKFYGNHGYILEKLVEADLYTFYSEIFIEAALIGLYYGKTSERDSSKHSANEATISRTVFPKKPNIEKIMFTFLQMEKKFQQNPIDSKEIFLYEDSNDPSVLREELISYALFGIEYLGEKYSTSIENIALESPLNSLYNMELQTEKELEKKVSNDQNMFYKSYDEKVVKEEMDEISKIIDDNENE